MADPHTIATFAFAQMRRNGELDRFGPKLTNTVVCVESDSAAEIQERIMHYFPQGGSIVIYYPAHRRFRFLFHGAHVGNHNPEETLKARVGERSDMTMGFLVDAIYRSSNWTDQIEISTADVEKTLVLAE